MSELELLDALKDLPIPYKEWFLPVLVITATAYRLYKRLEPMFYRKTLTKETVDAIEAFTARSQPEPDSALARVIEETRERYAFYQLSNMDVKEPLRGVLAELYLALPEADWGSLREAHQYIKVSEGEARAVNIRVPWWDAVGNGISILTGFVLTFTGILFMLLITEIARDAQDLALLLFLTVLCMAGACFFFITGVPPIRAIQLRRKLGSLKDSPVKLITAGVDGHSLPLTETAEPGATTHPVENGAAASRDE